MRSRGSGACSRCHVYGHKPDRVCDCHYLSTLQRVREALEGMDQDADAARPR